MNIDDITDLTKLRKLRDEVDNKIQDLKKQEQNNKVELAIEQFVGKFFLQYYYDSNVYLEEKNLNKFDIIYISDVHNITRDSVFCHGHIVTIDYDVEEYTDLSEVTFYDSVSITSYVQRDYMFDISHEYEEINNEKAIKLVKQAKKDAATIVDNFIDVFNSKETICLKN